VSAARVEKKALRDNALFDTVRAHGRRLRTPVHTSREHGPCSRLTVLVHRWKKTHILGPCPRSGYMGRVPGV